MATWRSGLLALLALACALPRLAQAETTTETILLLRHAEKPPGGLGQLNCQGLNRALALPRVLQPYGRPDLILAPNPSIRKMDGKIAYDYIRPLATIEPTAIARGLPVDTSLGYANIAGLRQVIDDPAHRTATLLICWEHHEIVDLLKTLAAEDHGPSGHDWPATEFDRLDVVHLVRTGAITTMTLEERAEHLTQLPTTCPAH